MFRLSHVLPLLALAIVLAIAGAAPHAAAPPTTEDDSFARSVAKVDADFRERFKPIADACIVARANGRTLHPEYYTLREDYRRAMLALHKRHGKPIPVHLADWEEYTTESIERAFKNIGK